MPRRWARRYAEDRTASTTRANFLRKPKWAEMIGRALGSGTIVAKEEAKQEG